MRAIGNIPDDLMKITLLTLNDKYLVKFELGPFEQVYKIHTMDVAGVDEVKKMVTVEFKDAVMGRFVQMRTDFSEAFQKNISS